MPEIKYRNFSVRASKIERGGDYTVEVLGPTPGGMAPKGEHETRNYDPTRFRLVTDGENVDLLEAVEQRPVKPQYLFALGKVLGDLILPGTVRQLFRKSVEVLGPDKRLRVRLIIDDPALAALPWEFMYVEELGGPGEGPLGFPALRDDVSIVRHESINQPEPALPRGGKYRIVAAFASPQNQDELNTKADRDAISNAIARAKGVSITPEWVDGATRKSLEDALAKGCDIFHFSGHGYFRDGKGQILLEKANGTRSDPYGADQLLQLLQAAKAKVAILGACEGGKRSGANQWTGIAPVLVKQDLAAVVASQYRLLDASALPLAEQLYGSLVQGETIDDGVYQARRRIFQQPRGFENRDWGALVLYLRVEDGVIFPQGTDTAQVSVFPRIAPARLQVPLVGRSVELANIAGEFGPGKKCYCHGAIGVGKTSLATEIFTKAAETGQYPGYLWDQVTTNDVESVLERLASFFPEQRVSQAKGRQAKIDAMRELVAAQPGLMIGLDEIPDEQIALAVVEATGDSATILNGQQRLNLAGKARAWEIRPLAREAAEELFLSLSGIADAADVRKVVRSICERMKMLPLGVTLAAQRCSEGESPETVLERLKTVPESLPSEHAEIRVLFQASYKELARSPEAQRLLVRLTWYPSREAPLEALRQDLSEIEFFQAKDKVIALGLATQAGRDRLAEHPLLGGLAHSEAPAGLVKIEEKQVAQWLLNFAKEHATDFDALDVEHDNLLGLLDRRKADRSFTTLLIGYLFDYLRVRGQWKELLDRLNQLLQKPSRSQEDRAWNLFRRGIIHSLRGSYDDALRDLQAAGSLFRSEKIKGGSGRVAYWRASVLALQGDLKGAVEGLKLSLKQMGEAPERAAAHSHLGVLLATQGDLKAGRDQLEQAVEIAERNNDLEHLAHAYLARGALSEQAGDGKSAQGDFQRALDAANKIGDPLQQALIHLALGYVHYHRSRFDDSRELFDSALSAFQTLGYQPGVAKGLHALGNAELAKNELIRAEQLYRKALELNKKYKQIGGAAYNEYQLGVTAQRQVKPKKNIATFDTPVGEESLEAEDHYKKAMEYARKVQDCALEAACFAQLTRLYLDRNDQANAMKSGRQGLELATQIQDRLTKATALYNLGLAQAREGNIEEASRSLADSHEAFAAFGGLEATVLEKINAELKQLKRPEIVTSSQLSKGREKIDRILPARIDRILGDRAVVSLPGNKGWRGGGSGGFGGGFGGVF